MKRKKTFVWVLCMLLVVVIFAGCNGKVTISDGKQSEKYRGTWYAEANEDELLKITVEKNKMTVDNGNTVADYAYKEKERGKTDGNPYYLLNIEDMGTYSLVYTKDDTKKALLIEPYSSDDYTNGKKIALLKRGKASDFESKEQANSVGKVKDDSEKGKIVQKVQKTATKLKSSKLKTQLLFEHNKDGKNVQKDVVLGEANIKYKGNIITSIWLKQKKNEEPEKEVYAKDGISYVKENDEWKEDKSVKNLTSDVDYDEGVKSFVASYEQCELTEDETDYTFTFKGKNEQMYDAIQPFFQLSVSGVETKDVNLDIAYQIDKKTYELKKIYHHIDFGVENESILVEGQVDFSDYNKDFEIP